MSDIDLESRFPEMRRIKSPPSLFTLNGCGLGVYGSRDPDPETGTYVKTQCLCILFIPILALKAFRVADAQSGWYFIGKVPLSPLAKAWNCMFLLATLSLIGFGWRHHHVNSADYRAEQQMAEAERLVLEGKVADAARLYGEVAEGASSQARPAVAKLQALIDGNLPLKDKARVLRVLVAIRRQNGSIPNPFEPALALAHANSEADPGGALAVLEAVEPLKPKTLDLLAIKQPLLERIVAQEPANPEPASKLAVVYEAQGQVENASQF